MGKYDDDSFDKDDFEEKQIAKLVKNGMSKAEAMQLVDDINNDEFGCDTDMGVFADITINEKLEKYNGSLTDDEINKEID